jgi:RNA polymerase sigma-70 factor (ECF subfamily)
LLRNPQHPANLGYLPALTAFHVGPAQHRNNLVNHVTFLRRLEKHDARKAHVVLLRCIEGMTKEQTAAPLNISLSTMKCDWHLAKARLASALGEQAA